MICFGIDVGSTSIKGAVLDLERREVRSITQRPFPSPLANLPAGHFEIDPQAVVSAVESLVADLLREAPEAKALFCSSQMGGVVVVDQDGNARTNYLSWRDQRTMQPCGASDSYVEEIRSRWANENFLVEVGNELAAGSTSSLLFWLAKNGQLPAGMMPATIADYVLGRLCRVPPQMDATHAIGLLDLRARDWHRAAFDAIGLDSICWPEIANQREPIGKYSVGGRSLDCFASFGDQLCALRGIGLQHRELSLNVSTGSQVSCRTKTFEPGNFQTRCYFGGEYLNTITHLPAGRSLNVLFDLLTELSRAEGITLVNAWEYIARRAEESRSDGLSVDLAFFAGPLGNRGRIDGITTENFSVGHLFYAAFVNMADNYALCAERVCPDHIGMQLAFSGSLPRSVPILRQLILDRLQMPWRESTAAEETLLGLLEIARDAYVSN